MDLIRFLIPNVHKEGIRFIIIFLAITVFLSMFSSFLGWVGVFSTVWCVYFFRDPIRMVQQDDDLIISPADGIVQKIEKVSPPESLNLGKKQVVRVSIFLNVFNVHVNRIPANGKITALHYHAGKFFNASLDKASIHNERQEIALEMKNGMKIGFSQIAGLIARRIVCNLEEKQSVNAGDRFGIIRFGSRMDVYLPENINPSVEVGQIAIGGETIIADLKKPEGVKRVAI